MLLLGIGDSDDHIVVKWQVPQDKLCILSDTAFRLLSYDDTTQNQKHVYLQQQLQKS